jgi:hypothetical protein
MPGRKAATRWQFMKARVTPKWRSRLPRMELLARARRSWPRSASVGGVLSSTKGLSVFGSLAARA